MILPGFGVILLRLLWLVNLSLMILLFCLILWMLRISFLRQVNYLMSYLRGFAAVLIIVLLSYWSFSLIQLMVTKLSPLVL